MADVGELLSNIPRAPTNLIDSSTFDRSTHKIARDTFFFFSRRGFDRSARGVVAAEGTCIGNKMTTNKTQKLERPLSKKACASLGNCFFFFLLPLSLSFFFPRPPYENKIASVYLPAPLGARATAAVVVDG